MNQMQTIAQQMSLDIMLDPLDDFVRVPGLLRRWELEQVVTAGAEFRIEEAGELSDKTEVFAVYRREHARASTDTDVGVPVSLTFDAEQVTVRARLLPISDGKPTMAVLVLGDQPEDAAALARVRDYLANARVRPAVASSGAEVAAQTPEGTSR
jgi:hypothetical protein